MSTDLHYHLLSVYSTLCPVFQVLGLKLPNMLGRAEKLTFQFSYGTKETSYGLSFFKPQPGHFERKYVSNTDVANDL